MSRFDEDTSTMRIRPEAAQIPVAQGIAIGAFLGAIIWAAIVSFGVAIWRWTTG